MKPERKEQLEVNDLEVFLRIKLPKLWKKHGNTVMMLLVLICAGVVFWNLRRGQAAKITIATQNNLAIAWDSLRELQSQYYQLDYSDQATADRLRLTRNTLDTFDQVLATNPKPAAKAWATLGRAEIYWLLANAPERALSTTQPVLGPATQPADGYLSMAEDNYKIIVSNHIQQNRAFVTALFALAAIEENRAAFDQAALWYDKLIDSTQATAADKSLARRRKAMLKDYARPLLITSHTQPTTQPGL